MTRNFPTMRDLKCLPPRRTALAAALAMLAAAALLAGLASAHTARAHGQGTTVKLFRGVAGGYFVDVEAQPVRPVVGSVHISVIPLETPSGRPVLDALITIGAYKESGEGVYKAPALLTPGSDESAPPYYDANITFREAGNWSLRVELEHDTIGAASLDAPIRIGRQPLLPGVEGTLVFALATGAIVVGVIYLWAMSRRARRRAAASDS